MIYSNKERAVAVAEMLNERKGYPKSYAVLTNHGWTVICSYLGPIPIGKFGCIECVAA